MTKPFHLFGIGLMLSSFCFATDDLRTWTNTDGKTIEAKIIDKKEDGSHVRLNLKNGKSPWIAVSSLSEADGKFIASWKKKPLGFDYLDVSMVGDPGKGKKTILLVARTWDKPATLLLTSRHPSKGTVKLEKRIEAYGTLDLTVETGNKYSVALIDTAGEVLSRQSQTRKE